MNLEKEKEYREKMIADKPFLLDNIGMIYTPYVRNILDISSAKYFEIINNLCCTKYSFSDYEDIPDDFSAFDFVVALCLNNKDVRKSFEQVLSIILKREIIFIEEYVCFLIKDDDTNISYINKDNFDEFQEILRIQNGIKKPKVKKDRSKRLRDLEKKSEKGRMLLAKSKGLDIRLETEVLNMGVFLNDLDKALDLNIYQFNNQYIKFMKFQEYQEKYKALLSGADKKDVDLKGHWTSENN